MSNNDPFYECLCDALNAIDGFDVEEILSSGLEDFLILVILFIEIDIPALQLGVCLEAL